MFENGATFDSRFVQSEMANPLENPQKDRTLPESKTGRRIGLSFVFLWFFVGGLAHFAAADLEVKIVPPYIPWAREVVFISGVLELLGALGLLWATTRRMAGIGLFMLTIAVTPANVYMLQHAPQFPVPYWLLWLRLPLQVGLLWLIWWSAVQRLQRGK